MDNQTPQSTFDEKLWTVLEDLYYAESSIQGNTDKGTSRGAQIRKAKAAIKALVLEVIGEDEGSFEKRNGVVVGGSYTDSQGERNNLRAQQRSIITKGE